MRVFNTNSKVNAPVMIVYAVVVAIGLFLSFVLANGVKANSLRPPAANL